jgi:hypothetical protein
MKTLTVVLAAAVAAAGSLSAQGRFPGGGGDRAPGFGMMGAFGGARTQVTGAPYSGVQNTQVQQDLAGGNEISRQNQSKVWRDGQGRVRIERSTTNPSTNVTRTFVSIFDPVAGFSYMLNADAKTAVKMPTPPQNGAGPQGRRMHKPQGAQVQTEDLGTQVINGLAATGTRTTETIPAGAIGNQQAIQIVRETWISTVLKVPVQIKTSDPRFGNTTMQLTNVTQAEPDPALFQIPADYTVTTRDWTHGAMMGRRGK